MEVFFDKMPKNHSKTAPANRRHARAGSALAAAAVLRGDRSRARSEPPCGAHPSVFRRRWLPRDAALIFDGRGGSRNRRSVAPDRGPGG